MYCNRSLKAVALDILFPEFLTLSSNHGNYHVDCDCKYHVRQEKDWKRKKGPTGPVRRRRMLGVLGGDCHMRPRKVRREGRINKQPEAMRVGRWDRKDSRGGTREVDVALFICRWKRACLCAGELTGKSGEPGLSSWEGAVETAEILKTSRKGCSRDRCQRKSSKKEPPFCRCADAPLHSFHTWSMAIFFPLNTLFS